MDFKSEVKIRRKGKNLSQRKLAKTIGITQATLNRIENGFSSRPNKSTIQDLCLVLNMDTANWMKEFGYDYDEPEEEENVTSFIPRNDIIYFMGKEIHLNKLTPDDLALVTGLLVKYF